MQYERNLPSGWIFLCVRKKKHVHIALKKPFVCYEFFNELLNFVKRELEKRRELFFIFI